VEPSSADNSGVALTAVRPGASTDPQGAAAAPRPGAWILVAVAVAVVLPVASAPVVAVPTWALRWTLLPAIAGLGLPVLVTAAVRGGGAGRPARWALAWLAWAGVATALAPQPVVAFWGQYRAGTGWLLLAAVVAAWAIGARAGGAAARPVATALLVACAVNAAVAVLSELVDLSAFGVAPYGGRAVGFYGNPVYLSELLAGGLWLAFHRLGSSGSGSRERAVVAAGVLIAAATELSGSRAALVLGVLAAVVAVWQAPKAGRAIVAAVFVGGIALGACVSAIAPGSLTGTDRVSTIAVADAGIAPRLGTWQESVASLRSRPLWGWGPGGTLAATGPRRSLTVARQEGPDIMFADAHDAFVEVAVATGVVGLALCLAWLATAVAAARRRRVGEGLLGFAALVLGVSLTEPLHPGVAPLAALALGVATGVAMPSVRARVARGVGVVVGLAGAAVSVWLLAALVALNNADLGASPGAAISAAHRLPPLAEPDAVVGRLVAFQGITQRDPHRIAQAIGWWEAAAAREPADPGRWADVAGPLEETGHPVEAVAAYRRALKDNPWSKRALAGIVRIGAAGGATPAEVAAARYRLTLLS